MESKITALPKSVSPKPIQVPFGGHNQFQNIYLLDLQGLEPHVILSLRKLKIYFDMGTDLKMAILDHGEQLEFQGFDSQLYCLIVVVMVVSRLASCSLLPA